MTLPDEALLLRIFIGEKDRFENRPLYEAIVMKARELHLAGATVLRGPMGYGHSTRVHRSNFMEISQDLPIVIEIVDKEENIETFRPFLRQMLGSGLVTLEKVQVLRYGNGQSTED